MYKFFLSFFFLIGEGNKTHKIPKTSDMFSKRGSGVKITIELGIKYMIFPSGGKDLKSGLGNLKSSTENNEVKCFSHSS